MSWFFDNNPDIDNYGEEKGEKEEEEEEEILWNKIPKYI